MSNNILNNTELVIEIVQASMILVLGLGTGFALLIARKKRL